jgi:cell wall-associated NlpC family hydrolase
MALNPGVSAAGQQVGAELKRQAGTPLSQGPANKWSVDSSDVTKLKTEIHGVVTEVGLLEGAIASLVTTLKNAAPQLAMLGGGKGGTTAGGGGLTVAGFGGKGGGGGPSGNTNTTAPVTGGAVSGAMGKVAGALSLGAFGGVAASGAGAINSYINRIGAPGMASNLMSTQSNLVFGQGVNQSGRGGVTATSQANSGVSSLGQADAAHAQSIEMANQLLWSPTGSKAQKNKFSFENQAQLLSPGMGRAGAAQFANTLASAGAATMFNRYGGGQAGLLLPGGKGINTASATFKGLMTVLNKGQNMDANQLKKLATDNNAWYGITQNFGAGTQMNLTDAEITAMREYAAKGGNVGAVGSALGATPASSSLKKTTQHNRLDSSQYQGMVPGTDERNKMAAQAYHAGANWSNANPSAVNDEGWAASGVKTMLGFASAVSHATEGVLALEGALKFFKGRGGGGGGGGGSMAGIPLIGGALAGVAGLAGLGSKVGGKIGGALGKAGGWLDHLPGHLGGINPGKVGGALAMNPLLTPILHGLERDGSFYGSKLRLGSGGGAHARGAAGAGAGFGGASGGWGILRLLLEGAGDPMGDPPTGSTTTAGMTSTMRKRVGAMMAANPNVKISSGHRTSAQQAFLYKAKGGHQVARPGNSAHQSGQAADLGPPSQFGWIAANASKFGLGRPDPGGEPWHVQAMGDPSPGASVTGSQVVSTASTQEGVNYVYGGETAGKAFDCSGLVQWVFAKLGISLPRTSEAQASAGTAVSGLAQAQPGDIILYNEPGEGPNSHVAIYIGGGKQIAAPHTGTVVQVQSVDTAHLSCVRRIVGGGAGKSAATAAQSAVGATSNDASNHATAGAGVTAPGLMSSFLGSMGASWLSGGMGGPSNQVIGAAAVTATNASVNTSSTTGSGTSATPNLSTTPTSTGSLSAQAVYNLAIAAGLSPHDAQIATAVAQVESRFNPQAVDHDSNGTTDYGLWQINSVHGVGTNMFNPTAAAAEMAKLTSKGANWGPWAPDFGSSNYGGNPQVGGKVQAAMQSLGFMGDPGGGGMGGAAVVSAGMSGSGALSRGRLGGKSSSGGGNSYTINMPITATGVTQQDAARLANMVLLEIKKQSAIDEMSAY